MKKRTFLLPLAALVGLGGAGFGQSLSIGSPAPAIEVSKWVKGDAFTLAATQGEQITVLEFWATW